MTEYEDYCGGLSEEEYEVETRRHFEELKECCRKDAEIIKALECCIGKYPCTECPYDNKGCEFEPDTLDLINRQKAEIKELKKVIETMTNEQLQLGFEHKAEIERLNIRNKALTDITKNYDWKFAKAKSEAIKEFAEKLKNCFCVSKEYLDIMNIIDNLIKEMEDKNV